MPCYPVYNEITDNRICNCQATSDYNITQLIEWRNVWSNNVDGLPAGCTSSGAATAPRLALPSYAVQAKGAATPNDGTSWWQRPASYVPWYKAGK